MDPIVKLLLEKGADVNACGGEHGTALAAAARIENVAASDYCSMQVLTSMSGAGTIARL